MVKKYTALIFIGQVIIVSNSGEPCDKACDHKASTQHPMDGVATLSHIIKVIYNKFLLLHIVNN